MNDTEILLKALGQLPDLVDAAKTYKETNDKTVSTLSTAIKERPKAVIPQKEVEKVTAAVNLTPCALPETDDLLKTIADMIRPIIHQEVKNAIDTTKITLKHEHTHNHHSLSGFWSIVSDVARKWIIGLSVSTLLLFCALAYCVDYVLNSELFLGKRCLEVYESEYLTEKEKKEMSKDFYWVSLYPKKYKGRPKALRERLSENESILNDREIECRFTKGKFSVDRKVGFED